jgi:hypothetical protein
MDTHQGRLIRGYVTHNQGDVLISVYHAAVRYGYEVTVAGRQFCVCYAFNQLFMLTSIRNEVFDGHDMQVMLLGELFQVGHSTHRAVRRHNLADDTGWVQACHSSEVNARLGVAGSHQHTAVGVSQWKDVARPAQVIWLGGGVNHR